MNKQVKIALVDDHNVLRSGLANLLRELGFPVTLECANGQELIDKLDKGNEPDIVLMDIKMPKLDGFETTLWLTANYPLINVIALSMTDDEHTIIKMIRCGAKGYLLKDSTPQELVTAINAVMIKGFYHSDLVTGRLVHSIRSKDDEDDDNLTPKEIEFLKLVCTELTYKEIAYEMCLSPRTIDGYRDNLFEKLNIKSRVGLVIYAIKKGIVTIDKS